MYTHLSTLLQHNVALTDIVVVPVASLPRGTPCTVYVRISTVRAARGVSYKIPTYASSRTSVRGKLESLDSGMLQ